MLSKLFLHDDSDANNTCSVQMNSPFSIDTSMNEDPSPLDVDPMASDIGAPTNNPTWFRRLSRDLGPTPIAV
jgi:hypothetical protein